MPEAFTIQEPLKQFLWFSEWHANADPSWGASNVLNIR